MSLHFHTLTVTEVVEETADSRSFVFDIPEPLRSAYAYQPGQFLTFEVPFADFKIRRCYSLSSAPESDALHKVTVKRVPDGRMSNLVIDTLQKGSEISVGTPDGRFLLVPDAGRRPLCLYAGGSGITPVISLMKSALVTTERPILLVYANRDEASVIFRDELAALAAAYPSRVTLHHHLDTEGGYLTDARVRALFAGNEAGDHYVCGPTPFMDAVERALEAARIDPPRRHFERFSSPIDADRRDPDGKKAIDAAEVPGTFVMRLSGKTHIVPYKRGLTLLASAKDAGFDPPSSCEDGYCGCCMATRVSGDIAMRTCSALSDGEVANGRVLLCQSFPTSAAPIEVDCDATSFRVEPSRTGGTAPPMLPRVLASLFVIVVMTLFFLFRTRG